MQNPRLATRYAKSLIDLAQEKGQLEIVYDDMKYLQAICKSNRDFVNLLKSPVIKADKKNTIITAVIANSKLSELTTSFIKLMVNKNREFYLPEVINEVVTQYNTIKGIHKVKLTTAVAVGDDVKNSIIGKINTEAGFGKVELETIVDEALIGGFVLEFDNNLVDASILRDLNDIKKQFLQNHYVHKIR
jgi:F-type H+-transporting ATPase subunit delta